MLSLPLAAALFDALHPKCQLVLVGDVDQLPPVGALRCVSASLLWVGWEEASLATADAAVLNGMLAQQAARLCWSVAGTAPGLTLSALANLWPCRPGLPPPPLPSAGCPQAPVLCCRA
jgi:hypothetical protein